MHGEGDRRTCPTCQQPVDHIPNHISNRELRGPRQITSSNIDRVLDDHGRFLFIEEKHEDETVPKGQGRMLRALSYHHDVWLVRGNPERLRIWQIICGNTAILADGDYTTYQKAVLRWFANPPAPGTARDWLQLLEVPYTAPDGIPKADWDAFDTALTTVAKQLPGLT